MNQLVKQSTSLQTLEGQQTLAMKLRREMGDMPDMGVLVKAAAILIGSDPTIKPHDPERYVETMVAHLSKYPRFVLERIIDPRNGVMTLHPFPPKIADVERFAMPIWDAADRQLRNADNTVKQLAPPEDEISKEDQEYVRAGFKKLLGGIHETNVLNAPKRKPDLRSQSSSDEAIREKEGWRKPEPKVDPEQEPTPKQEG